jgi:hypothetical protein
MLKQGKLAGKKQGLPSSLLKPGTPAPDFTLPSAAGEERALRDFRGQPVVLVFYPADFSPVCGDQLVLYNSGAGVRCLRLGEGQEPAGIVCDRCRGHHPLELRLAIKCQSWCGWHSQCTGSAIRVRPS